MGKHHHHHHSGIKCLIQILETLSKCECDSHDEGSISLNQGHHEVAVSTSVVPSVVFLAVSPLGTPVCVGDIDMVGYSLLPDGFILYADIKSNSAEVCYYVQE
jgi:hypothetical protein